MSKNRSSALKRDREQRKAEKHADKQRRREERKRDDAAVAVEANSEEVSDSVLSDGDPLDLRTPGEPNDLPAQP